MPFFSMITCLRTLCGKNLKKSNERYFSSAKIKMSNSQNMSATFHQWLDFICFLLMTAHDVNREDCDPTKHCTLEVYKHNITGWNSLFCIFFPNKEQFVYITLEEKHIEAWSMVHSIFTSRLEAWACSQITSSLSPGQQIFGHRCDELTVTLTGQWTIGHFHHGTLQKHVTSIRLDSCSSQTV